MLSNKEVQIGSSMARIFAFAIVPSFLIQAFALTSSGYDATWGPVLSVLNVVTGFALLFVFALTTKLYGDDNNPYVRITGSIACLLYTSPSPRDQRGSRMPSSA